jgi:hypothetical protein
MNMKERIFIKSEIHGEDFNGRGNMAKAHHFGLTL